jgi:hypothetical protein
MPSIHDVQEKVVEFFSKELGKERETLHFIKMTKSGEGWIARVEVTEPNEYLKKLGYPQIFDKNIYTVNLDPNLEIVEYALTDARERSYATEEREEI